MDIMQIVAIGLIATVLIVVVKSQRPELGVLLSLVAGIIIFLLVLGKIGSIMDVIMDLTARAEINMVYLGTILKIIGIAYIAEFGAQISRDAGESAVATKIEFAAKIMIMVLAVPMIVAVLQMLLKLVP
ncbi:stage III sporulation protein AD [Pelotomaculum terephthalicicum JT]|uniref:stage III sporulation protein AD n=1 Tax=Pelotomaculum TaxID=191373 RepID=UPI0009C71501|nr:MULTISPECIES: stage III sporulation protein AD [Pelotomaculum]MCG9968514.1 stage III sporulation protein AD [Pelotomaculum terephthalicicum JT]OPX85045.1 MAG: Stage III sporulation protein AC/AD protein family protein [Pelotomaculum sp. PtaB.Bin117]OPY62755.1 MAG: Stage III sporulation protein AC/AD protein family protein [Pelotomaculum sp. PtaU1.Bin065]